MASHEPTIWSYVVAVPLLTLGIAFYFAATLFMGLVALTALVIACTGALRLGGHVAYSVTALLFGSDSRFCGLILDWEQEELDYRKKRRRKALEAAQAYATASLIQQPVDQTNATCVDVQ